MTERVGLLGYPVAHSVSPPMHNAAFAALGLDWHYDLLPVPPENFADEVAQRTTAGYRGFNVTIPHKQAAFALPQVVAITPAAQAIGAVNTLVVGPDGTLTADNTDWQAFARVIEQRDLPVGQMPSLVLGTGGSAQAVIYALQQAGALSITQVSRDPAGRPGVIGYGDLARLQNAGYVVINCTPVGMHPDVNRMPWGDGIPIPPLSVVYDLVYNPDPTKLVRRARERDRIRAFTGLDMLVWQGAFAFEQWTGQPAPFDIMFAAAEAALKGD